MSSAFEGLPKTPNLKLNKPGYDNVADIEALNENADILDEEIQGIKNTFVKSVNGINAGDDGNVDLGIIPISQGGTGQTTASGVRNALGLGNTTGAVPIANGGTGATTASDACKNLGAVQTVNGKEPDAGGNVNVEEYIHPNSGVTAGTYRSVTVNAQGHVTGGSNPTLPIANGGTGATTASQARVNLGINIATIGASGIPNYSAGINIPHNKNYTIPSNGVVVVDFCNYNSEDYLMINNVYMFKGNAERYLALEIGQFIVGANDVVKHYHGYSQTADSFALERAVFYPFRN